MAAVWFFFAIGVLAFLAGAIIAGIIAYGIVASYVVTAKAYTKKRIALRKEKIDALKLKDVEVKDNENIDIKEEVVEAEGTINETEEVKEANPEEIAKDILGK